MTIKYLRSCPSCQKNLYYSTIYKKHRAIKVKSLCHRCASKNVIRYPEWGKRRKLIFMETLISNVIVIRGLKNDKYSVLHKEAWRRPGKKIKRSTSVLFSGQDLGMAQQLADFAVRDLNATFDADGSAG